MKKKILIIDDEPAVLDFLKIVIDEELGQINADFAKGLEEALEKIQREEYQAIISEFYFKKGNILPLYMANREAAKIPIALLSDDYPDYIRGWFIDKKIPMDEVAGIKILPKPCGVDELVEWIKDILATTSDQGRESR